jgi:hypothetical protein
MNGQPRVILENLLCGCVISSTFFVLSSDSSLIAKSGQDNIKPRVNEAKFAKTEANLVEINISQAQTIKKIIATGNTVLTEEG